MTGCKLILAEFYIVFK